MILRVMIITAVLTAAVLFFAATKPKTFRIQRSVSIDAPPERIFPLINDFHNWARWAPQNKENPNTKRIFSGSERSVGAVSEWTGTNSQVFRQDMLKFR
jgi:hypothetical protein